MRLPWMLGLLPLSLLALGSCCAQEGARPPETQRGELVVPFVRTHERLVHQMLDLGAVTGNDVLYDLGCGDGRIVITAAAERGTRGVGVDIDPKRIAESRENARKAGVTARVRFFEQDLFETDVREATVVMLYLLPEVNLKLRPMLLRDLQPGTRLVSHEFDMREWRPDRTVEVGGSTMYLWVIPARVEGTWALRTSGAGELQQGVLSLHQHFQEVSGSVRIGEREVPLEDVALTGVKLTFLVQHEGSALRFHGQIGGDTLRGTIAPTSVDGEERIWTATRQTAGEGAQQR